MIIPNVGAQDETSYPRSQEVPTAVATGLAFRERGLGVLEVLYGRADIKGPFSVIQLMTSAQPYGALVSLDGIHPSGEGQRVIAGR